MAQDIYTRTILYPYLFGKTPLISALLQMKYRDPPQTLPPPLPIPPSTPVIYRSFFKDTCNSPLYNLERAIVHTSKLRSQTAIDYYKNKGLQWLRRYDVQRFPSILRNPTIGCMVELSSKQSFFTVHIDSREAKKIIYRECYF